MLLSLPLTGSTARRGRAAARGHIHGTRRYPRHPARRRRRRAPVSAHQGTREAGGLFRRAVPHHRLHAEQLHQLRPAAHLHRHAVQVALAQPAHPHGLERRLGGARRVHRDPAAAEARRRALVSRHRRRGLPEPLFDRARVARATSSCCRATTSTRWTTRRCCGSIWRRSADATIATIEVPRRGRVAVRHRQHRRIGSRDRIRGEAAARRRRCPARRIPRWPRWASTSFAPTSSSARSRKTPRAQTASTTSARTSSRR